MSNYIGTVGDRLTLRLTLKRDYCYQTSFGWKLQDNYIYTLEDSDGNVFVWKTSTIIGIDSEDKRGHLLWNPVHRGDEITLKGTVKEHSEYKGTKQTVLTRCKVVEILNKAPTKEEIIEAKKTEQMASLNEGDFIWKMPYRQYKEHYSDCETVAGSFDRDKVEISVIIREGRLVPSGVRGRTFHRFVFENKSGDIIGYRAVSEENAKRQLLKDRPGETDWECVRILR